MIHNLSQNFRTLAGFARPRHTAAFATVALASFAFFAVAFSSTPLAAQVLVMDSQLNAAVLENNRLTAELLDENQALTDHTLTLLETVGAFKNVAIEGAKYPTDLLTPSVIEKLGLGEYNATILTTPLAIEALLQNYVLLNPYDMKELDDAAYYKKYKQTKNDSKRLSTRRQLLLAREAIMEGYGIALAARQKAAATGTFLQDELRGRARQSSSIREDLMLENMALAEMVGQLGTLVAASASELEIVSANALLGIAF